MDAKYIAEIKSREQAAKTTHFWEDVPNTIEALVNDDIPALIAEVERLGNMMGDYGKSARIIALYLSRFCNRSLPYDEMISDAARKADEHIHVLKRALMQAIRDGHTDLSPESHQKLFDYYIQREEDKENSKL